MQPNVAAPVRHDVRLRSMTTRSLDAVMRIEKAVYPFPWTRGNFVDSLSAGHLTALLGDAAERVLGYSVAMAGVDEMHLLNLTVAPEAQGHGHARVLIDALLAECRARRVAKLWLEVRVSNAHARAIYERLGFVQVGLRKGYYPAANGREDAIVMSLALAA